MILDLSNSLADTLLNRLAGPPWTLVDAEVRIGGPQPTTGTPSAPGAVPDRCVFIIPTGGYPSVSFKDGGAGSSEEKPTWKLLIRSPAGDPEAGFALADAVYGALHHTAPKGFFNLVAEAPPAQLDEDDQNRTRFVVNVVGYVERTSGLFKAPT